MLNPLNTINRKNSDSDFLRKTLNKASSNLEQLPYPQCTFHKTQYQSSEISIEASIFFYGQLEIVS